MSKGFNLIELIVVLAVMALIAVFALPSFLGGARAADLNGATQDIVAALHQAQNQSAQELNNSQWGIHFNNPASGRPSYSLFMGGVYASGNVKGVYQLPPTLGFATATVPVDGSLDIIFSLLSGNVNAPATIKLYVISQPSLSSTIMISAPGRIAAYTASTPLPIHLGTLGSWRQTTPMPYGVDGPSYIYNHYLYVLGGYSKQGTGYPVQTSTIIFSHINNDGTLGGWQTGGAVARDSNWTWYAPVGYAGHIYVVGGTSDSVTASAFYANINADGTIGSWSSTTPPPIAPYDTSPAVDQNGGIYFSGAYHIFTGVTSTIYYAKSNADGSINIWNSPIPLPFAGVYHGALVYNGHLYVFGGSENGAISSSVYETPILADGSLSGWTQMPSLPFSMYMDIFNFGAYGNHLYEGGGLVYDGANHITSTVLYSAVNPDGTLGSWQTTTPLPIAIDHNAFLVDSGYAYSIGGESIDSPVEPTSTVFYSPIQ